MNDTHLTGMNDGRMACASKRTADARSHHWQGKGWLYDWENGMRATTRRGAYKRSLLSVKSEWVS